MLSGDVIHVYSCESICTQVSSIPDVKARLVDDYFLDLYVFAGGLLPDKSFGWYLLMFVHSMNRIYNDSVDILQVWAMRFQRRAQQKRFARGSPESVPKFCASFGPAWVPSSDQNCTPDEFIY